VDLNPFARRFADALFSRHPDWRLLANVDGDKADCLIVSIEAPAEAASAGPLLITADDEVTVGFDFYHSHFDWPPMFEEMDTAVNALSFIEAILSDEIGVVSYWNGDAWQASSIFERAEAEETVHPSGATRVRRRSWRGSLNSDTQL
jgi:hypothetical protein